MRYTISLTLSARRAQLADRLAGILAHAAGVRVVSGLGRNAVTVEMEDSRAKTLANELDTMASIEPARQMHLLQRTG